MGYRFLLYCCALWSLCSFAAFGLSIEDAQLRQNPNPKVPLAWLCTFKTDVPAQARVALHNGRETQVLPTSTEWLTEHEVVVLGVRPGHEQKLAIKAVDAEGHEAKPAYLKWDVAPLSREMPKLEVYQSKPTLMEPGITFIPCNRWVNDGKLDENFGAILGLNAHGDVVWSYQADHTVAEVKPLSNGNLLIHYGREGHILEIDRLGTTVRRWYTTGIPKEYDEGSIPIVAETLHHEVIELPSGNFLALSTEIAYFATYPDSEYDRDAPWTPAYVVGDVVVEFEPDGTVVKRTRLLEILDPYRIGYDSLNQGFWGDLYFGTGLLSTRPVDWSHANSLDYNPIDQSLLISVYHQDAVIKIDYPTGELQWIMGYPTGWLNTHKSKLLRPVGEGHYFFHQHTARLTPVGTIMLFDNGTFRARPFDKKLQAEKNFSRVVEFELDEKAKTYKEVGSDGGRKGEMFFSPILSEADWMPKTQNILITDGARIRRPDGSAGGYPKHGHEWARVLEVTRTKPAVKVFEVVLDDPNWGWTIYRSERIPSLYPKGATLKMLEIPPVPPVKKKLEVEPRKDDHPKIEADEMEDIESLGYL